MNPIKVPEKNTIQKKKIKLQYTIEDPSGIKKDFERFVKTKYGFTRGIIGREALKALSYYMGLYEFENYKPKVPDTISQNIGAHTQKSKQSNLDLMRGYLEEECNTEDKINFAEIQDIMRKELDITGARTHEDYVDALEAKEIVFRYDNVPKYDHYFFKRLPELSRAEIQILESEKNLTKHAKVVYKELIKVPGKAFEVSDLLKLPGLDEAMVMKSFEELEDKNLARKTRKGFKAIIRSNNRK